MIAEEFFWEKVDGTLRALTRTPVTPDWAQEVLPQVVADPGVAVVLDLEVEGVQAIELLQGLREDPSTADIPILAYGSHERQDLLQKAEALGAQVVARSTFASSLVRILQELCQNGENGGPAEAG